MLDLIVLSKVARLNTHWQLLLYKKKCFYYYLNIYSVIYDTNTL